MHIRVVRDLLRPILCSLAIATVGLSAIGGVAVAPATAADGAEPTAADAIRTTETFVARTGSLRPNTEEAIPTYTCPSQFPFLVGQRNDPSVPLGVTVIKGPNIWVVLGGAPIVRGGYALGWSGDERRTFALHYDPTFEAGAQGYIIMATCTNDITQAYKP